MDMSSISFYDLLKERYRKKKVADMVILQKEDILSKLKMLIKKLTNEQFLCHAIPVINDIADSLEERESLVKYDMNEMDLDLLLLAKAIVLCCGDQWEEAEDVLYQLTDKYKEAVFYALLGFVRNKQKNFKCSRDTLSVAQLELNRWYTLPSIFHNIDVAITNLSDMELRSAVKIMMIYTKDKKELPTQFTRVENLTELNQSEGRDDRTIDIGRIIRKEVFPIIRVQIDSMLRLREPQIIYSHSVTESSTQTDKKLTGKCQKTQTEHFTLSKGIQSDVVITAHKSMQTALDKPEPKNNKELTFLRTTVHALNKENSDLKLQLKKFKQQEKQDSKKDKELASLKISLNKSNNENIDLKIQLRNIKEAHKCVEAEYETKLFNATQEVMLARTTIDAKEWDNHELEMKTKTLLCRTFKEISDVQSAMCSQAKVKYDTVHAAISALRDQLETLGLRNYVDATVIDINVLRYNITKLEAEISEHYKHFSQLIMANQIMESPHFPLIYPVFEESPNILLNIVSKLVTICQNNRAYQAELTLNAKSNTAGSSHQNIPPEQSERNPLLVELGEQTQNQIVDQEVFNNYITEVQERLPNCSLEDISRYLNDIRWQRKVPLADIEIEDIVNFINSNTGTVKRSWNWNIYDSGKETRTRPGSSDQSLPPVESDIDFPPILAFSKRKQKKIIDQALFEKYVIEVQKFLPNCSLEQISRCVNAIRGQRRVPLNDIHVKDIVHLLSSKGASVWQKVNNCATNASNCSSIKFLDVDEETENICTICLDDCNLHDVSFLECTHFYHKACIREWLTTNNQCPICRHTIRSDDI